MPVLVRRNPRDHRPPDRWTVPTNIRDLIEPLIESRYLPSFEYYPIIEQEIPEEKLRKIKGLVSAMIYLEQRRDHALLSNAVDVVVDLLAEEAPEPLRMFVNWMNAMFRGTIQPEDAERIRNPREVKPMLAQLADEMRAEWKRKGLLEGRLEGRLEGKRDAARKMLRKGYPLEDVLEITGLPREEIESLSREAGE
jgi:hypothetical protein